MSTERMGRISIVVGEEEISKGDRVGNMELLDDGVCLGNQGSTFSEGIGCVTHPGVVMLDGRVSGEEV